MVPYDVYQTPPHPRKNSVAKVNTLIRFLEPQGPCQANYLIYTICSSLDGCKIVIEGSLIPLSWLIHASSNVLHKSLHESTVIYIEIIQPPLGIWQLKDKWNVIITMSSPLQHCQRAKMKIKWIWVALTGLIKEAASIVSFWAVATMVWLHVDPYATLYRLRSTLRKAFWWEVRVAAALFVRQLQFLWSRVLEVLAQVCLPPPLHAPHCVCSDACHG